MKSNRSQNEKLLDFFKTGKDITENVAKSRYGIERFSARIAELRAEGYSIYRNNKKTTNGETITVYRFGTPNRQMVAAAYKELGAAAFA